MNTTVIAGPWKPLPLTWFASINSGASAFSVTGSTRHSAACNATCRLYAEIRAEVYALAQLHADAFGDCDVFALDTASEAEVERRVSADVAKLELFTPREWDERCLREHHAHVGAAS